MDGAFAVCVLVTLGFGAFIVWGRSAPGRRALRQTLGEPASRPQTRSAKSRSAAMRRTAGKSSLHALVKEPKKPSERPASTPSSALKTPRASAPASQKTVSQKPADQPRSGRLPRSRKP